MKRCGECGNAWPIVGDLTKRICRGAPPQLVVIQGPALGNQVQVQITPMYPHVSIGDIACAGFKVADRQAELQDAVATIEEVDKQLQEEFGDSSKRTGAGPGRVPGLPSPPTEGD